MSDSELTEPTMAPPWSAAAGRVSGPASDDFDAGFTPAVGPADVAGTADGTQTVAGDRGPDPELGDPGCGEPANGPHALATRSEAPRGHHHDDPRADQRAGRDPRRPANQTHASLDGLFAAHANRYALALARSGWERVESVAAAALACFDSRLLDPARGAALATLNMTLALRPQLTEDQKFDVERTRLAVGIAGFDRYGRFRAAANFPMAVWAVTSDGPVQLGEARAGLDSVEVEPVRVREDLLQDMERPLLLIAAGSDLSVVGRRLRGLTTLNATPSQLAAAVIGPLDTNSPLAVAVAARASERNTRTSEEIQ